jgi:hypothetical protein
MAVPWRSSSKLLDLLHMRTYPNKFEDERGECEGLSEDYLPFISCRMKYDVKSPSIY